MKLVRMDGDKRDGDLISVIYRNWDEVEYETCQTCIHTDKFTRVDHLSGWMYMCGSFMVNLIPISLNLVNFFRI